MAKKSLIKSEETIISRREMFMQMQDLKWIGTTGGPLLLMSEKFLPLWGGIESSLTEFENDYERACSIDDYIAEISIGSKRGLVLDQELTNASIIHTNEYLIIIRSAFYEDDFDLGFTNHLPTLNWQDSGLTYIAEWPPHLLFDSSCPGSYVDEYLPLQLNDPVYQIMNCHIQTNPYDLLLLHWLKPNTQKH